MTCRFLSIQLIKLAFLIICSNVTFNQIKQNLNASNKRRKRFNQMGHSNFFKTEL